MKISAILFEELTTSKHGARYGPLFLSTHICASTEESMGKIHGIKFEDVLVHFFFLAKFHVIYFVGREW